MIVTCTNCGIEFDKPAYYVNRGMKSHFCCQQCRGEFVKGNNHPRYSCVETVCSYCGEEIIKKKSQFDKSNLHFCNVECKHNYNKENSFWGQEHPYNYQGEVDVKCVFCEKEFTVPAGQYNFSVANREGNFCCSRECVGQWNKKRFSGENAHQYGKDGLKGELNPSWKGGITPFIKAVRLCGNYYRWKNKVLEQDKYKCQICGNENNLVVHHKIPLIQIIRNNEITNMEESNQCKELWDVKNGVVLCSECHRIEHLDRSDYNGI